MRATRMTISNMFGKKKEAGGKDEEMRLFVGDVIVTVTKVTVREEEPTESAKLFDLEPDIALEVVDLGTSGRRLKVKTYTGEVGWITKVTVEGQYLVKSSDVATIKPDDLNAFKIGTSIELLAATELRTSEADDAAVAMEMKAGSNWEIVEFSEKDKSLVKVKNGDQLIGWIRIVSKAGELLVLRTDAAVADAKDSVTPADSGTRPSSLVRPFLDAAKAGDIEGMKTILETPVTGGSKFNLNCTNEESEGKTALLYAAANGRQEIIELLLSLYINVNQIDNQGRNALHYIALSGEAEIEDSARVAIAQLLVDKGVDGTVKDSEGKSPADAAASTGCKELINLLKVAAGEEVVEEETESSIPVESVDSTSTHQTQDKPKAKKKASSKKKSVKAKETPGGKVAK